MIRLLKKLFSKAPETDYAGLLANGAVIVDVRTTGEYASGHLKRSINIPLNTLGTQISKLKKDKAIITCCASGMRSASARSMLLSKGFNEVYNGGSWQRLKKYEQ
jgi:phage shock protein E